MARNLQSVRLLEADPDLGTHLSAERFERARTAISAPVMQLLPGLWLPPATASLTRGQLGMLILEGTLTRDVAIADTACAELVGQGDFVHPSRHLGRGAPIPSRVEWHVLTPSTLAIVDSDVLAAGARFPEVFCALAQRGVLRAQTLAVALAISHMRGIEMRLLALLWHLADRFGRVTAECVELPLPLTHRMLSRMLGAGRPTVSSAMKALENEARIAKRAGGGFRLLGDPPEIDGTRVLQERRPDSTPPIHACTRPLPRCTRPDRQPRGK